MESGSGFQTAFWCRAGPVIGPAGSQTGRCSLATCIRVCMAIFLRPGDGHPCRSSYQVGFPCVTGGSFTYPGVQADPEGKPIFHHDLLPSRAHEEGYANHAEIARSCPGPKELALTKRKDHRDQQHLISMRKCAGKRLLVDKPIEIRPVEVFNPFEPKPSKPSRLCGFAPTGVCRMTRSCIVNLLAYALRFHLLAVPAICCRICVVVLVPRKNAGAKALITSHLVIYQPFAVMDMIGWLYANGHPSASGYTRFVRCGRIFQPVRGVLGSRPSPGIAACASCRTETMR